MKKLISFIAAAMCAVTTASAEDLSAYITAGDDTGVISINGEGAAYGGQLVSILIAKDEGGFYSPDIPLVTEAASADENGGYSLKIQPYPSLPGGEYKMLVSVEDESITKNFIVVDMDNVKTLFKTVKELDTATAVGEAVSGKFFDMGISKEQYEKYESLLLEKILKSIKSCKDEKDFLKLCRSSVAMLRINEGEAIEKVLSESENSMFKDDVTCRELYSSINSDAKAVVMDYYTESAIPADGFADACALAAINTAKDWKELETVLSPFEETTVSKIVKLDTSDCSEGNIGSIMQLLYKEIDGVKKIEDVQSRFIDACDEYKDNKGKGNGGGGGSSSSGSSQGSFGSAGSSIAITSDFYENENKLTFNDINGHWGEKYIKGLAEKKVVSGYEDGTFRPDGNVTRAEFVSMLCKGFKIEAKENNSGFGDVPEGAWYAKNVASLKKLGIIYGDEENNFCPDKLITREDASVMLMRLLEKKITLEEVTRIPFNDASEISEYAKNAVAIMTDEGIISGNESGYFNPKGNTTRAQAAVLLTKAIDLLNAQS